MRLEDVVTELEDRRRALEDELKTAREATRAAEQAKIRARTVPLPFLLLEISLPSKRPSFFLFPTTYYRFIMPLSLIHISNP